MSWCMIYQNAKITRNVNKSYTYDIDGQLVTNQKHVYSVLQLFKKKRLSFTIPYYLEFNLAMYTIHIL